MKNKHISRMPIVAIIALAMAAGCAKRGVVKDIPPPERFRVALINGGVYRSLGDQATMDLSSLSEVELITGSDLDSLLAKAGTSQRALMNAGSFEAVAGVDSLDFALILIPAPPTFVTGAIGIKSINWRTKKIAMVPGLKSPTQPAEWLLAANNGWARFTSEPTGARLSINDKVIGVTPLLLMMEGGPYRAYFEWTPKYNKSLVVNLDEKAWVYARAPDEYAVKHESSWYARLQAMDNRHGEKFFIAFYIIAILASTYILIARPFGP